MCAANNPLLKGLLMVTELSKSPFITFKPAIFIHAILCLPLQRRCVRAQHSFIFSALAQLHSMHRGGWRMQIGLSCCAHNPETSCHCIAPSSCGAFFWKHPLRGAVEGSSWPPLELAALRAARAGARNGAQLWIHKS